MQTTTTAAPAAVTTSNDKVGAGDTARHTPGPWIADGFGDVWVETGVHRCGEMTRDICAVHKDAEDWRANATLIAAAPDLLAALKELTGPWERGEKFSDMDADVLNAIRWRAAAAIAKAEGRS